MPFETFRTDSKKSRVVWLIIALTWFSTSTAGICSQSDLQKTLQQLKPATSSLGRGASDNVPAATGSLSKGAFDDMPGSNRPLSMPVGMITSPNNGGLTSITASSSNSVNRPVTDKWALVIGVSKFKDPTIPSLKFAAKDAQDFGDFLVKEANFAPDHVHVLVNEQATQRQIMSALGDKFFPQVVKKDDLVIVFYSSHGSPRSRDVRKANFLVAYDTQKDDLFATGIDAASLTRLLRERVQAERILIIMDACHSGGAADGAKDSSSGANFDLKDLPLGDGQMLISSSAEDEKSWESKRYHNGVFTRNLLQSMRGNAKSSSISEIVQGMLSSVQSEVLQDDAASQTPKLRNDKWSGNDLILAVQPSDPHPLPVQVRQWFDSQGVAAKPSSIKPGVGRPDAAKLTTAAAQATHVTPVSAAASRPASLTSSGSSSVSDNSAQSTTSTSSAQGNSKPSSTPAIVFSSLPGAKPSVNSASYPNPNAALSSGVSQNASGAPNVGGFPSAGGFPNAAGFPNVGGFPSAAGFPNAVGFPNPAGTPGSGNFGNNIASAGTISGQAYLNDSSGLFTPPDGSFSALLLSPNISVTPGQTLYSSVVGHAKFEVLVADMAGAKQVLVGLANNFAARMRTQQGFMHLPAEIRTIGGYPAVEYKFWNLKKKSCVILCATDTRMITFSATIGAHDKNELTFSFFNSLVVH